MKIISWNMQRKHDSWRCLLDMDIDLALLQEAGKPPPDVASGSRQTRQSTSIRRHDRP